MEVIIVVYFLQKNPTGVHMSVHYNGRTEAVTISPSLFYKSVGINTCAIRILLQYHEFSRFIKTPWYRPDIFKK